jgi:hypothetical protein
LGQRNEIGIINVKIGKGRQLPNLSNTTLSQSASDDTAQDVVPKPTLERNHYIRQAA